MKDRGPESMLGKRARSEEEGNNQVPSGANGMQLEDDDDDIGPMPMPDSADNSIKKKRKGV
jgi:peptidylprolyl isomerase domain and WD repeat-containing protein 1